MQWGVWWIWMICVQLRVTIAEPLLKIATVAKNGRKRPCKTKGASPPL
jgi:hypothetical protein